MNELLSEVLSVYQLLSQDLEPNKDLVRNMKSIRLIEKIPGDASTRKYYRVQSQSQTFILMKMDPFTSQRNSLPFIVVQNHLLKSGVDVPSILDINPEHGCILLEDLGDITLLKKLQEVSTPDAERHLYEKVIDALVQLQVYASPKEGDGRLEAFQLRFDYEKLMWEVQFTIDHFYQLYLKRKISEKDQKIVSEGFSEICTFLASQPTVLTHRDFHSRNVMISFDPEAKSQRFVMIDFQDARMGPAQYDLASLLKDSYYQLEEAQITRLIDYYVSKYEALSGYSIDRSSFIQVFDLMSVQRNFKAIGSFASFMNRRSDPTYLKYIGNTFENIRRTLLKFPKYSQLRETLFHYYYF